MGQFAQSWLYREDIRRLPSLEHGTKFSNLAKIFDLENGGLKPGKMLQERMAATVYSLRQRKETPGIPEGSMTPKGRDSGKTNRSTLFSTWTMDNCRGAKRWATLQGAIVTEDEIPLAYVDRAADICSGQKRKFRWPEGEKHPILDTVRCECGRVQPAGFEFCLCCNRRDKFSEYRAENLRANPAGAQAFQKDTQQDVGGSFEERVKRVLVESFRALKLAG